MYCKHCGREVADQYAVVCPYCCRSLDNKRAEQQQSLGDGPNFGIALVGFLFPLIGIILFCCWHSSTPQKASSALKGAVLGIIISVILAVFVVPCSIKRATEKVIDDMDKYLNSFGY